MRRDLSHLRRRAIGLEQAGLYQYAERAFHSWWVESVAQDTWTGAAEAAMRATRLALDQDRPAAVLRIGTEALPLLANRPYVDPNVMARLHIFMAKAAWYVGRTDELRVFVDAAASVAEQSPVEPLVRAHLGIVASLMELEAGDLVAATAWAVQSLDVARAIGDENTVVVCRENLSHLWAERSEFGRARGVVADLLLPGNRDVELVDVLVGGIHIALAHSDLTEAVRLARRAVDAYSAAPSLLGPVTVAYLFEALAAYHAAGGAARAAEILGLTARGWFALRNRRRDVERIERWLGDLRRSESGSVLGRTAVDPDLLYLGDLFAAAHRAPEGAMTRALARSVHRLLREVVPAAPATPCEHAALLRPLSAGERWFTGRSASGRAAELVLSGADAAGKAGLDLLAAFERLSASGAPWRSSLRILRRAGVDPAGVASLDRIYRSATA